MAEFYIRPAEPRDIASITRIYEHAVRHGTASFEIEPPNEAEMARRQDALLAGGYPFLVAERGGAGFGHAHPGPDPARPAFPRDRGGSGYVAPAAPPAGAGGAGAPRGVV